MLLSACHRASSRRCGNISSVTLYMVELAELHQRSVTERNGAAGWKKKKIGSFVMAKTCERFYIFIKLF
jgi:hypothetical protein